MGRHSSNNSTRQPWPPASALESTDRHGPARVHSIARCDPRAMTLRLSNLKVMYDRRHNRRRHRTFAIDKTHSEVDLSGPPSGDQGARTLSGILRHDRVQPAASRAVVGIVHDRRGQHRHPHRRSRQAPAFGRLLLRREAPVDHLRQLGDHREGQRALRRARHADDPRRRQGSHPPGDLPG